MAVPLLLALIWVAVLVPPAMAAHARRRADLLVKFGHTGAPRPSATVPLPVRGPVVTSARRRRQVLGGLLVAMVATLVAGLLPPLRVLLVVHLFLVDSFLAYVTVLVHLRRGEVARSATASEAVVASARRSVAGAGRTPRIADLPPLAVAWRNYS